MLTYGSQYLYLGVNYGWNDVLISVDNEEVTMMHEGGDLFSIVWEEVGLPFILRE